MSLTDQLRKERSILYCAVRVCAAHFHNEEVRYLSRDELEKARANSVMAAMCEQAMQQANNQGE